MIPRSVEGSVETSREEMHETERIASQHHTAMHSTARKANVLHTKAETECTLMPNEMQAKCLLRGISEKDVV